METDKIDIIGGPSKEEMAKVYRSGGQNNVCFELQYGIKRTAYVDIVEIQEVLEKHVKMLASMPAGFFMYSQGEDPRPVDEKLRKIKVHVFYTTNIGKGYIEKVIQDIKNETNEPRECPRCHGRRVDPHHFQDDCQRCGGVGKVYGDDSKWSPPQFVD